MEYKDRQFFRRNTICTRHLFWATFPYIFLVVVLSAFIALKDHCIVFIHPIVRNTLMLVLQASFSFTDLFQRWIWKSLDKRYCHTTPPFWLEIRQHILSYFSHTCVLLTFFLDLSAQTIQPVQLRCQFLTRPIAMQV